MSISSPTRSRCWPSCAARTTASGGPPADSLGLLALVAGQDVEPAEGSDGADGRRASRGGGADRVISTVDPGRRTRESKSDVKTGSAACQRRAGDRADHRRGVTSAAGDAAAIRWSGDGDRT